MDQLIYDILKGLLVMLSVLGVLCGIGFIVVLHKTKYLKRLVVELTEIQRQIARNYEDVKYRLSGIETELIYVKKELVEVKTKVAEKEELYLNAVTSVRRELSDAIFNKNRASEPKKKIDEPKPMPVKAVDPLSDTLKRYLWAQEAPINKPKKPKKVSRKK